ncbi:hypothetical protein [Pseudonocardia acaciae]|uniref:hypothetical protein n=1 Tax=Pseudonocardia acaciae TaxID=551276 RepID=UPI0012EEC646|nr:hypothetical protein [Pseudonocardia acaciae]
MTTTEVQWSELQRDPKGVAALADKGAVRVRRRDGDALLLIKEEQARQSTQGALIAARTLRIWARLQPDQVREVLREEFAWLDLLPVDGQAEFVTDFVRKVETASELNRWSVLEQMMYEWRSTAEIYADPELFQALTRPIDGEDHGPVPPPVMD